MDQALLTLLDNQHREVCDRLKGIEEEQRAQRDMLAEGSVLHERMRGQFAAAEVRFAALEKRVGEHSEKLRQIGTAVAGDDAAEQAVEKVQAVAREESTTRRTGFLYPAALLLLGVLCTRLLDGLTWLWHRLFPALLLVALLIPGCKSGKGGEILNKQPVPTRTSAPSSSGAPASGATPAPKSGDEWRAEKQRLLDLIGQRDAETAALRHQALEADRRAGEQDQEEAARELRQQAALGRKLAGLVFGLAVLLTIFSFTPWGAWVPRWAGPAGMAVGVGLLIAAQAWSGIAAHLTLLGIIALVAGAGVALLAMAKAGLLLHIRQGLTTRLESAQTDAEVLDAKADALEAELLHGVHHLGQRLRKKPPKTHADVAELRAAANRAREGAPE